MHLGVKSSQACIENRVSTKALMAACSHPIKNVTVYILKIIKTEKIIVYRN